MFLPRGLCERIDVCAPQSAEHSLLKSNFIHFVHIVYIEAVICMHMSINAWTYKNYDWSFCACCCIPEWSIQFWFRKRKKNETRAKCKVVAAEFRKQHRNLLFGGSSEEDDVVPPQRQVSLSFDVTVLIRDNLHAFLACMHEWWRLIHLPQKCVIVVSVATIGFMQIKFGTFFCLLLNQTRKSYCRAQKVVLKFMCTLSMW